MRRDRVAHKHLAVDAVQLDQLLINLLTLQAADPVNQFAAVEIIQALKAELLQGVSADDQEVAALVRRFISLVPTGVNAVIQTFASPLLSSVTGSATENVLGEIQGRV